MQGLGNALTNASYAKIYIFHTTALITKAVSGPSDERANCGLHI